ncbi:hypothetical protein M5689_023942 [Euphorbia peplus]|nr:hypothetical protein M5689_023942 [Euphorbia peplus]
MASNLKMLPEPFDSIIAEMGGGDGGNSGFWKGFGEGNSDGWRRKGGKTSLVFRVLAIWGLGLILFGKDLKNETLLGFLVLGFFIPILFERLKKGRVKDWVMDVCLVGAVMGWRLNREDLLQWVQKVRVSWPLMELVKGKQTSRRRRIL